MPLCRNCGSRMGEQDWFCKACGAAAVPDSRAVSPVPMARPGASPSTLPAGFVRGQVMALIGCLMLVIGPFLSWTTAYLVSGNSLSGLQQTNNEAFVLVILGIAGAAFAVASLALRRRTFTWAPFVVGLVCLGLSVYYYIQLRDQLRQLEAGGYAVSLGIGIYLCLAASVIVLLGAVVAAPARKTSRTESIELRTRHGSPK